MTPSGPLCECDLSRHERSQLSDSLARRAHDSDDPVERESLLQELIEINVRVARAVAARYRGRGIAIEDLEQAACEGLIKAVHRFDPTKEHDLLSYAVPTIRGEVLRYFRDQGWMVRPPRRIQELQGRIRHAREDLALALGREPSVSELCEELQIDPVDYKEAVQALGCFHPASLDQPLEHQDHLAIGDNFSDGADLYSAVEARVVLTPIMGKLSERERRMLHLRFFLDQTQREIGERLGLHQVQVSRGLDQILRKVRTELTDSPHRSPAAAFSAVPPVRSGPAATPARRVVEPGRARAHLSYSEQ